MDQNSKSKLVKRIKELGLHVQGCKKCGGTGLLGFTSWRNAAGVIDHSWSGEYCNECNGLGFLLPDEGEVLFPCPRCKGSGEEKHSVADFDNCYLCNGTGVVDWIENVTRRSSNDWNL